MKSFKTFLKQLSESYIVEAISDLKKQYKNIPENVFDQAVNQDPTYIPGSPKPGQYTLWILNLINNYYKNKKNEENYNNILKQYPDGIINGRQINEPPKLNFIKPEDIYKIKTELSKFNKYKKHLNKNINQFKDLPDLTKANNSIENIGISTNKKVLRGIDLFKKAEQKGLKIVFNNKNWLVGIPKTKESSVVFADDTRWCTTQNSADFYEEYMYKGPLYINLNKKTGELYQFHFETNSFMDSDDKSIDENKIFDENPDLYKFYFKNDINIDDIFKNTTEITKDTINSKLKKYIKNIEIPNNITTIDNYAFANCRRLQSVIIPDSVTTIGNYAFSYCKNLKSIKISNNIIKIGEGLFYYCENIQSIEIPNSVTTIGMSAFGNCENLKSIKIPNSVKTIGNEAFLKCKNLKSIEIPNSVTTIRDYVFWNCENLQSVTIPDSIEKIGAEVFYNCNIKEIYIKGNPDNLSQKVKEELKNCSDVNVKIYIINK